MSDDERHAYFMQQLGDIISRYELSLPITTEQLLADLDGLNNPHDLMKYFGFMHSWVAEEYGDAVAASAMPEIASLHSAMPRSNLGGLTYKELEAVLDDMQTITKLPTDELRSCYARADMVAFLKYIGENEPLLTKTLKQINRKSISEINALMTEPQQAVHDYGTVVFTDRDEHQFWHISFLRSLAQAEHMTYVRNHRLHLSKRGTGWLGLDAATQTESLFRSWCEVADWSFWNDYYYDIVAVLQRQQPMLYQAILALDKRFGCVLVQSLDDICATLCGVDNSPDDYEHRPFSHVSYSLIVRPFIYFGLATYVHPQKDYMSKTDFTLTSFGVWMLNNAMREQWLRAGR